MPKIDVEAIPPSSATTYPEPFASDMVGRSYRRLGPDAGLTRIGASLVEIAPGGISSQRHWHTGIDELVVMLEGEAVLVEEGGETLLRVGDIAAFAADTPDGHHLLNRSERPCRFLAVDNQGLAADCHYPDVDLHWDAASARYRRKNGSPY